MLCAVSVLHILALPTLVQTLISSESNNDYVNRGQRMHLQQMDLASRILLLNRGDIVNVVTRPKSEKSHAARVLSSILTLINPLPIAPLLS